MNSSGGDTFEVLHQVEDILSVNFDFEIDGETKYQVKRCRSESALTIGSAYRHYFHSLCFAVRP